VAFCETPPFSPPSPNSSPCARSRLRMSNFPEAWDRLRSLPIRAQPFFFSGRGLKQLFSSFATLGVPKCYPTFHFTVFFGEQTFFIPWVPYLYRTSGNERGIVLSSLRHPPLFLPLFAFTRRQMLSGQPSTIFSSAHPSSTPPPPRSPFFQSPSRKCQLRTVFN